MHEKTDKFHDRCKSAYNILRREAIEEDDAFDAPEKFPGPSEVNTSNNRETATRRARTANNTTSNNTAPDPAPTANTNVVTSTPGGRPTANFKGSKKGGRELSPEAKDIIKIFLQEVKNDPSIHPRVGGGNHGRALHRLLTLRRRLPTKELAKYSPELLAVRKRTKHFQQCCESAYNTLRRKAIEEDDAFHAPEKLPGPSTLVFTSNTNSNNTATRARSRTSNTTATTTHTSNHRAPQAPGLPPTETLYVTNNNNNVEPTIVSIAIHQQGPLGMTISRSAVGESCSIDEVTQNSPAYLAGVRPGDVPVLIQMNELRLPQTKPISYNDFSQMESGENRPITFSVFRRPIINSSIEGNNNRDTKQPAAAVSSSRRPNRNGEEGGTNVNASSSNQNLVRF